MRLTQSNKLLMYDAVDSFLRDHPDQLSIIAEFMPSLTDFRGKVQNIKLKEVERQGATAGKTDVKYAAEGELIKIASSVAASLYAYARKKNIQELKNIADVSIRKLDRMKEVDLITKCTQLYKEVKKYEADIGGYGLGSREIESLKTKTDNFSAASGKRDSSVADRIGTSSSITELFNESDDILEEELDKFVDKFMDSDKPFYDGYWAARNIKDLGKRHNGKTESTTAATPTGNTPSETPPSSSQGDGN